MITRRIIITVTLLLLVQIVTVYAYGLSLKDIEFSYIGDEYAAYNLAKSILDKSSAPPFFSLNGVYDENPVAGSYYQAIFMHVFGNNIFAWKMSSITMIFPLGIILFLIVHRTINTSAAFAALLIHNSSYFFHNFFQIGYLNNQVLLFLYLLILAFTIRKPHEMRYMNIFVIGLISGLSWFFYVGKLFPIIAGILLFIFLKKDKSLILKLFVFGLPIIVLIGLSIIQSPMTQNAYGMNKTFLHPEYDSQFQIIKNILYPYYVHFTDASQSHYLPRAAYTDPITSIFAVAGFIYCVFISLKHKDYKASLLVTFFILLTLTVGGTSPYFYPPTTRGIVYVVFYVLFAIIILNKIITKVHNPNFQKVLLFIVTFMIVPLNIHFWFQPFLTSNMQALLRYTEIQKPEIVILDSNSSEFNQVNYSMLHQAYKLPGIVYSLSTIDEKICIEDVLVLGTAEPPCSTIESMHFGGDLFGYRIVKALD